MQRTLIIFGAIWSILTPDVVEAKTGMGLVVDAKTGKARRIDLKDGKVVATSAPFGSSIIMGRFSPDGSKLVTIDYGNKVVIRDLSGKAEKTFTPSEAGGATWASNVSWTNSGLWVGGLAKAARYNTSGVHQETVKLKPGGSGATATTAEDVAKMRVWTVSHNDRTAAGRGAGVASILFAERDGSNRAAVVKIGDGCGVGVSPDGSRLTQNLVEEGKEHRTMKIHGRQGGLLKHLDIYDMFPAYSPTNPDNPVKELDAYSFTMQSWSSNGSDIILVPAGRCYPMDRKKPNCSTMPWIYNLSTKQSFCLYDGNGDKSPDPYTEGVFWFIRDFYKGKISSGFECNGPSDCNDGKVCTKDVCTAHQCSNPPIADCCTSSTQCNDGKVCTKDVCSANTCSNPAIANCCTSPSQCIDGVTCTEDKCVSNQCQNPSISGCCKNNSDCDDGNPCTTNTCNTGTGACSKQTDPNCCQNPSECDDEDICTDDKCVDNTCSNPAIANCCKAVGECDDKKVCTTDTCDSDRCHNVLKLDCCEGPGDCDDADDCTEDVCNVSNQCENPAIDGCVVLPSIDLESPQGGEVWEPGSTVHIKWSAQKITEVVIFLSKNGGESWDPIGKVDQTEGNWGDYQYAVPKDVESDTCMVMVEDYEQLDSAKSGIFAIRVESPPKKGSPGLGVGVLSGGCEIRPGGGPVSALPWLMCLVIASLIWTRRRQRPSR